ncbi:hypothetical protein [Streptomyces aquilus]|uniref:hypothetical protein n=1 Tax=Streptomyces aquilus TaxID=2548456 RepID=UPI001FCA81D2|nr:hypothetical protein [Streptomyces aquilus]
MSIDNPELLESPVPDEATPEPAPAKKRVPRRRVAAVAGSVLLLGAVVGGSGYTVVTVQDADRDPGRPTWQFPRAAEDTDTAEEAKGLRGLLVPYARQGFGRGPDLAEFGTDAELSGKQATALRKESIKGLPPTQRRQMEKQIDRQRIKGVAMRSYLNSQYYQDKATVIGVVLTRMESRAAVRNIATAQSEFFDAVDLFRKGPKVEGHKEAKCFLTPKDDDIKIDRMFCSAYVGEVLVELNASGGAPMDQRSIARFLADQLGRIDDPGKAV